MAILDKIDEIPANQRLILAVGLLVIIVGGFYQFIYKSKKLQVKVQETQLAQLNNELQDLRAIQKKLKDFEVMIVELESQLVEAQRQLPRQRDIPVLLNDISEFGKKAGMEFVSFRPSNENAKGFYADVPISLVINGPFHNLANFVDAIVHYPRIIKVQTISIGSPAEEEGHVMLRSTCTATTYRYLEDNE